MLVSEREWQVVAVPGFAGRNKTRRDRKNDELYGKGSWKTVFRWGDLLIERVFALQLYEDAYVEFFKRESGKLEWLAQNACDVYDNAESNVDSALDYAIQETNATHLQDIAVRRSLLRLGRPFHGNRLIQIRGPDSEGYALNPGLVPFHMPALIVANDQCPDWAETDSIEAFWQCNKVLVAKRGSE